MGDLIILQFFDRTTGARSKVPMKFIDEEICLLLGIKVHESAWAKIIEGRDNDPDNGFGIDWHNTIGKLLADGYTVEEIRGMNLTERGRKVLDFLDSRFTFKIVEI